MKNSGSLISFFLVSARKMVGPYCVHYTNNIIIIKLQIAAILVYRVICLYFIIILMCVFVPYNYSVACPVGVGGGEGVEGGSEGAHECLTAQGPRHP